jgi:cobalamin biosynthetic protein CobC
MDMTAGRISAGVEGLTYHGGALDVAELLAPHAAKPWIDLSTGVNPHAYPLPDLDAGVWTRLPDRAALAALEQAAAARYGAHPEAVVAGPGSQALLHVLVQLVPRGAVGALGLTYGGYAEAFESAGVQVAEAHSLAALADCAVAVVANPNNPDGRRVSKRDLLDLHARLASRGGLLIVDEAFADFDASESLAPILPAPGAVALRSFGKTYGLAGLRLGFAVASPDVAAPLRRALGPWPVSGPAIAIGASALGDTVWLESTAARLATDSARLDALLITAGWRIVGGTRLFCLGASPDAGHAFRRLMTAGILTRPFAQRPDWLRFGVPGEEIHWSRLAEALGV